MSGRALGWAFARTDLGPTRRYVLVAVADAANDEGECWPSQPTLARKTGLSERAVREHLAALEEGGYLSRVERRRGNGSRRSTLYQLPEGARQQPAGGSGCQPAGDAALEPSTGSAIADPVSVVVSSETEVPKEQGSRARAHAQGPSEEEVNRLCEQLAAHVNKQADSPGRKRITKEWQTEMERLVRIDGRTVEQVAYVIKWLASDDFWRANVLSARTLRKQFDKLVAKIKASRTSRMPSAGAVADRELEGIRKTLEFYTEYEKNHGRPHQAEAEWRNDNAADIERLQKGSDGADSYN